SPRMAKRRTGSAAHASGAANTLPSSRQVDNRVRSFIGVPFARVFREGLALTAYHPAILMGDNDRGGAWATAAIAGGVADTGVLDVDPQGAIVRRPGDAGNFRTPWTDQKAPHLATLRVGAEQLVATGVDRVGGFVIGVSLNPQAAVTIEGHPGGGGEAVALDGADQVSRRRLAVGPVRPRLVTGEQEQIPLEGGGGRIAARFTPAQDLPVLVVRSRVGGIQRQALATLPVIGQGDIHLPGQGMYRHPFRAIHRRRAKLVGGAPGIEQYRLLIGKAVGRCQPLLAPDQG